MVLGAVQGLNIWLVFIIARIVAASLPTPARTTMTVAAVAISAASPMAFSELGTSMADVLTSLPVLAGLALLMRAERRDGQAVRTTVAIGAAGALLGVAVSLKLTNAAFALGLAAACLIGWPGWRGRVAALLATGIGGAIGFAAVGGFWYLRMWRTFGNPVFPYFNNFFRSPDYPQAVALYDRHYIPHSLMQAIGYPLRWTQIQMATTEVPFRDIRFALLMVLGIAAAVAFARRGNGLATTPGRRLAAFFAMAFCLWMVEWSIQRYLVVLELLIGPLVVVLLQWSGFFDAVRGRAVTAVAAVLAVACLATVRAPDWGHLGWRKDWYEVTIPPPGGTHPLYFLAGAPLSYVVPELPRGSTAIGVIPWEDIPSWGDTVFLRRIHDLLGRAQDGAIWAMVSGEFPDGFGRQMAEYGLKLDGRCQTNRGRPLPLTVCPLVRAAPPG
jgi:hypothetical protein